MTDSPYPSCIGSGYCCWKAPCPEARRAYPELEIRSAFSNDPRCPELRWTGERHACGLVLDADAEKRARLEASLFIGVGCCSPLNTWRREPLQSRVGWSK